MDEKGSSISRLKVPTFSFLDKTPTPTRLLRAVDEIGLFREDEPASAKSTSSSNNPFDEHFRKALQDGPGSNKAAEDNMLHTPQILAFPSISDLHSAPPSASVVFPSPVPIPVPKKTKLKPIAPVSERLVKPVLGQDSEAQLLLRMPTGRMVQLTKLPFCIEGQEADPSSVSVVQRKKSRKGAPHDDDIRERNRAAASRSRVRKRQQSEQMKEQIASLVKKNRELMQENATLKNELSEMKAKLSSPSVMILQSDVKRDTFIRLTPEMIQLRPGS